MVSYHYMFLLLKCFQLYPKFKEVISIGPNLIWTFVICPNVMQVGMKLFQFTQMVPIVCKFE